MKRLLQWPFPARWCTALLWILALSVFSCTDQDKQKTFTIGFSQCVESDLWRQTMLEEMKRELTFHPNFKFFYKQADGNSQKQIRQVKELVDQKIDLLIISPNEAEPLTPAVEEVFNQGIPVIVVDRKISSLLYTAYIGADNYEIGKMAGQYAAQLLKGNGNLLQISGLPTSSPAVERQKGFFESLKANKEISLIQTLNGAWEKGPAKQALNQNLTNLQKADVVFAHNDIMALGVQEVIRGAQVHKPIRIIGVDGLSGPGGGIQMVADNIITATLLYPTGGQEAIQVAARVLNKEEYKRDNYLQTSVVDSTNVRLLSLQNSKVLAQQTQIERQQKVLAEQQRIYNNQRTFLYILISTLLLTVTLGGVSFFSLRENRKINKKLKAQNDEIIHQKKELEQMSLKAQAANEAKVEFFTNISHEFRTPLTLILGPLEELQAVKNATVQKSFPLIHKNVIRLLRLVNQLIDFRKIEVDKMRLQASAMDLIPFIQEIMQSFQSLASKKNIDLKLVTKEKQLLLWFDPTMLDKVLFNLLSNAFKFTKDNGFITVSIQKEETANKAVILVEDDGIGMSGEALEHAFELFYQGEQENNKGSGLGLALSKELIRLHHGLIKVNSEKWKGTRFTIELPLGRQHLSKEEIKEEEGTAPVFYEDEKIYTSDLLTANSYKNNAEEIPPLRELSLLIVEDNEDLRTFLAERFKSDYEILEADNSQSALQQGFDRIPDLILCDIVIPGKDGISLTNIFKSDIRTSHIPIILLSSKTNIEQQIEGMKNKADAYITKPFNVKFLDETIKSLLSNRNRLREHFTSDLPAHLKTQTINKLDRKFVSEFSAYIESNLSNEDLTVEDVCRSLGVSKVQLYRKAKALLGINVSDYILNTRLAKAKYLLQHEDYSISEIAYKVGFSSPAYFATVFKSKFGSTPKAFKEK